MSGISNRQEEIREKAASLQRWTAKCDESIKSLRADYEKSLDYTQKTRLEKNQFLSIIDELERLKKLADDNAKITPKIFTMPRDAEGKVEDAQLAYHEERSCCIGALQNIADTASSILYNVTVKDDVFKSDISLLKESIACTNKLMTPGTDLSDITKSWLNLEKKISTQIETYEKRYKNNLRMPEVWSQVLVGLGLFCMAAGVLLAALSIVASIAGPVPAALTAGAGIGIFAAGIALMRNGLRKNAAVFDKIHAIKPTMERDWGPHEANARMFAGKQKLEHAIAQVKKADTNSNPKNNK